MAKLFFENKYILTKKLYRQYCRHTFQKMNYSTRRLCFILMGVSMVLTVVEFIFLRWVWLTTVLGCFDLYFLFMGICGYHYSEWMNYRDMQQNFGEVLVHIVRFCSDQIQVKVNTTSLTMKYSSIIKAYETEDLIILIIGTRGMVEHGQVVYKKGFFVSDGDKLEKVETPDEQLEEQNEQTLLEFKKFINTKAKKIIFPEAE